MYWIASLRVNYSENALKKKLYYLILYKSYEFLWIHSILIVLTQILICTYSSVLPLQFKFSSQKLNRKLAFSISFWLVLRLWWSDDERLNYKRQSRTQDKHISSSLILCSEGWKRALTVMWLFGKRNERFLQGDFALLSLGRNESVTTVTVTWFYEIMPPPPFPNNSNIKVLEGSFLWISL